MMMAVFWPSTIQAQSDSLIYTTKRPLVYEDAWDLWPYVFLNEKGEPDGYNIDLLKLICKELDLPYIVKLMPTQEAHQDLIDGKSDMMFRMDADFTRGKFDFSKNIIQLFTHSVVMPKSKKYKIEHAKDLRNYTVIVHEGSFSHHLLTSMKLARHIEAYDDMKEAIQLVTTIDKAVIVWNTMSLKWLIQKYHPEDLEIAPIDIPYGEYKFASKDSKLLLKFDSIYSYLRAKDKLLPIQNKWFYPEHKDSGIPAWVWKLAVVMLILAAFIILYYFVYRHREQKMTEAVRKSNERLTLILQTSGINLWTYNTLTRTFTFMDEQGKSKSNISIESFAHQYHADDLHMLQEAINDITQQRKEYVTLNIQVFEDPTTQKPSNYTITLSVLRRGKSGMPLSILCTRSDITDDLFRQVKGKDTMLRYRAIFNTVMIDMVYYDENGYIADMNQKAREAIGVNFEVVKAMNITIQDVVGIPDLDLEHFDYIHVTQIFQPHDERPLNKFLKRKQLFYELLVLPFRNSEGKLIGLLGTGRDVTEVATSYLKQEKNMIELQEANKAISEYIDNFDYVLNVGGIRLVKYNFHTHLLTMYQESKEKTTTLTQSRMLNLIAPTSKKTAERVLNIMDNQSTNTIHADIKTMLHSHDNQPLHLQFHFIPTYDKKGNITEYFGMCRDISEIKSVETKLAHETLRAQEVEELKNSFLHNMSFEIRTPLNAVVGFAELFQMEHTAEDEAVFIKEIKENSAKLLKLINDILYLSRLDAGMITSTIRPVDVAARFEAKCEEFWGNNKKPGVNYIVKSPYKKLVLEFDEPNLSVVLEKVIQNAVQYTEEGSVLARYDYIGNQFVIAVDDTGPGIPKDMLEHLFERFVSGDTTSRAGLGLSICSDLMKHLGGKIEINSTVGKGTSVWFTLPCNVVELERN